MNVLKNPFKKRSILLPIMMSLMVASAQAEDVKFSGFLSVGGGMLDDGDSSAYNGIAEDQFQLNRNIFGLQATADITDKISSTVQMIARSEKNYQLNAEWAYLTYKAADTTKIRLGRLRSPFYMYSDFLDVGYAYAWISAPRDVYSLPVNNVDGIDVYTTFSMGPFDSSLQAYFGSFSDLYDLNGVLLDADTRNQMGLAATIGQDWWTLRAAFHKADVTVDVTKVPLQSATTPNVGALVKYLNDLGLKKNADGLLEENDDATFAELGLTIDTGTFVAAIEHVEFDPGESLFAKNVREYAMVGVRAGDWLFHVTAHKSKDEMQHPEKGIPEAPSNALLIGTLKAIAAITPSTREVLTLGARWDFTASTALKIQYDDIDDADNLNPLKRKQKVFSVAVQTVF